MAWYECCLPRLSIQDEQNCISIWGILSKNKICQVQLIFRYTCVNIVYIEDK